MRNRGWAHKAKALFVVGLACGVSAAAEPTHGVADGSNAVPAPTSASAPTPAPDLFPEGTRSLALKREAVVRAEPSRKAKAIGKIARGTRVAWSDAADGDAKCPRWIEIQPRGWLCEKDVDPSTDEPGGDEQPVLKPGEIVPGKFGKIVADDGTKIYGSVEDVKAGKESRTLVGELTVRRKGTLKVDGKTYWLTEDGELIDAHVVKSSGPSDFEGVALDVDGAPQLPFAWAQSRGTTRSKIKVHADAKKKAPVVRELDYRTIVAVLETSPDGKWARIGDGEWVATADLHLAVKTDPPTGVGDGERWIDVDLDQEVLVAYEGTRPVFATMISPGRKKFPTPTGIFRLMGKEAEAHMKSPPSSDDIYDVNDVPWTMPFSKYYALHGAYWHDRFGQLQSHGCVNLAPKDARRLYGWTLPAVPPGWSEVDADEDSPGTLVRLRNKKHPNPEFRGYAKKLLEQQAAATAPDHS